MKQITSSLKGLASSLLLNAGLSQAAQKLDPVSQQSATWAPDAQGPASCVPCYFTPKPRK